MFDCCCHLPVFEVPPESISKRRKIESQKIDAKETNSTTVILPVVLYGCETWTLTLREEQRLRVFENKVLRKIFGAKRDEVTGKWRKLHNTELHALYSSPDIIRNIKSRCLRWAGHVARMGESRNAYRVLVGRPEGKRLLGRPRRRWEDNIKMDWREVGYDDRDWIDLAQDRDQWRAYVRAAMNLRLMTPLPDRGGFCDGQIRLAECFFSVYIRFPLSFHQDSPSPPHFIRKSKNRLSWIFNHVVSATQLFSFFEIGDSEMVFGEMRPSIRYRLPDIRFTVVENLGKTKSSAQAGIELRPKRKSGLAGKHSVD
ncbi:hypothetical protein ANN_27420 [Periplaneta americana]|uniref:Uncharacterized protein n=1 Tax=Periplaneta americana TaxID=6978 RepID=A0ABQ8RVX4_PERAM|nr:hypothetical protein ANN_27420 [Periplaneta americana]